MSVTTKFSTLLTATAALMLATIVNTSAYAAIGIPGSVVPLSGTPHFTNEVSIRANKGSWTISGKDGFSYNDGTQIWAGSTAKYDLSVDFDNSGNVIGGDLNLKGKLPGLISGNGPQQLLSANVLDYDFTTSLIGFSINNLVCNSELGACNTSLESIWIQLDAPYLGDPNARFRNSGLAVTTIPVPAAVWLFGSGLAFLGATARRRRARKV